MEKFREMMSHVHRILLAFVVIVATSVLSYKILSGAVIFNMSNFTFTDLLSMVLALFAIALSLIFYHKATETSNTFYDNTYRFTSHVSEVLGRIEAGFSERLRHIDESYSKLGDRFDKMSPPQKKEAEAAIVAEEKVIEETEEERNKLLEELARRAQLQESEKNEILTRLRVQESELADAHAQVRALHHRLASDRELDDGTVAMGRYARSEVLPQIGIDLLKDGPTELIKEKFNEIRNSLAGGFLIDMRREGLLSETSELTQNGLAYLRRMARVIGRPRRGAQSIAYRP